LNDQLHWGQQLFVGLAAFRDSGSVMQFVPIMCNEGMPGMAAIGGVTEGAAILNP